jgi:hypothetical protein
MDLMTREISGAERRTNDENPKKREPDLRPEYCRYRDEGCDYADSCLTCPFEKCLYDEPRGRQHWLKSLRNREISRLFSGGWEVTELALLFGVSERTIQRALKTE